MLGKLEHVQVAGEASNVAEAIATIPRLHPDFVILDIQLPDGDGIAVLETIKRVGPRTVVAMLTNYADDYHRLRCEAAGADFFLDKAKQFDEIPRILQELQQARAERHG